MGRNLAVFSVCVLVFSLFCGNAGADAENTGGDASRRLQVYGVARDVHGKEISDACVEVFLGGKELLLENGGELLSDEQGMFHGRYRLEKPISVQSASLHISVQRHGYQQLKKVLAASALAVDGDGGLFVSCEVTLARAITPAFWIAAIIFVAVYLLISFELLHRTVAAMLGASAMLVISYTVGAFDPGFYILSYDAALRAIDANVIMLLLGMMMILGIFRHSGIFPWCALQCFHFARGNAVLLVAILMVCTAIFSAFLDNVTTMLLLTPITIEIASALAISPMVLLIPEVLASNIGGTATLIGDPPNIMIGSYADLPFIDFVINLAPSCLIVMVVLFVYVRMIYGRELAAAKTSDLEERKMRLREQYRITDKTLLVVGLVVLIFVVALFLSHSMLHMEVSVAALAGAALLFSFALVTKRVKPGEIFNREIEWSTLLFFFFLFILVGGVTEVGVLDLVSQWVMALSQGNVTVAICLILWVSALMSAFVDNIPFTATMLPVVAYLSQTLPGAESGVLWWALAFGACFGGNGTMIGASANVVTMGLAEAHGYRIGFVAFMKTAFPLMLLSVIVANLWLLFFY